jgi:hypothetical protein
MIKFKMEGFDKIKKQLDYMATPEFAANKMIEIICERVPEAKTEKDNFKFSKSADGKIELKHDGLSPELYSKIMKAFEQQ